ncbi:MAG TPA: tRNA lysidine(34) synthetase TilS [Candidatus Marinimicrobia bacterium]|nr:tRNA lysidine(34) synthetase TilS [Candidatus Neomarinimicrobiota bacterium]
MKPTTLRRKFVEYVEQNRLLNGGQTVIAGISGGVDSMCLLDLLISEKKRWKIEIVVTHFNHQIRGTEADSDEELVRRFCDNHSLPFFSAMENVPKIARAKRISLEMAGRELRYAFFQKIAAGYPNSVIATAHTLDDQAETILLRMLKGTGLQGLSGIAMRRENIIRPLLFATKAELYGYARTRELPFAEDRTNLCNDYERNFIRNQILPAVEDTLNPNIRATLANLAQNLDEAHQFMVAFAGKALESLIIKADSEQIVLDKSGLKNYFIAVEKEIIWQCLQRLDGVIKPLNFKQMNQLIKLVNAGETGRRMKIAGEITVLVDRERLILQRDLASDWSDLTIFPGEKIENEFFTFSSELMDVSNFRPGKRRSGVEFIDFDLVGNNLGLRHWQRGDRMIPLGMNQSKKISDILVDLKVPLTDKNSIPVFYSEYKIIWLCGLTLSDEFKVTSKTKTVLKLIYKGKKI